MLAKEIDSLEARDGGKGEFLATAARHHQSVLAHGQTTDLR